VNGSGKHVNWSFGTSTQNLLEPGESPYDNLQFLFFCTAVLRAVDRHQDLLRLSVAHAGNDHRLGANEAPPAIISVFLGAELEEIFEQIAKAGRAKGSKKGGLLGLGVPVLPDLPLHTGDRNRTSPFAFTGNKFEFRAVGSSQSISFPTTVLNTIVAESIDEMTTMMEKEMGSGKDLEDALRVVLGKEVPKIRRIIFNGDGYSEEWQEEAARRGLLNLRSSLDALRLLTDKKNVAFFEKYGVYSQREIESREEIYTEQYFKTINIEGETAAQIARTMVLPATIRYLSDLLAAAERAADIGVESKGLRRTIDKVNTLLDELTEKLDHLTEQNEELGGDDVHSKANHMRDNIIPAALGVREVVDKLEKIVPDDLWPLPTYREMLFVK
jgi:glutamine synthetase